MKFQITLTTLIASALLAPALALATTNNEQTMLDENQLCKTIAVQMQALSTAQEKALEDYISNQFSMYQFIEMIDNTDLDLNSAQRQAMVDAFRVRAIEQRCN